jgi:hypothetical protein
VDARDVTVALARTGRNARPEPVGNRQVDRDECFPQVVVADSHTNGSAELVARQCRGEQHGAADRVTSEQRALRTAQNLDAGDVAKIHDAADGAAHVHLVNVQTHAGIDTRRTVGLADTANEYLRRRIVAGQRTVGCKLEIRCNLIEIVRAEDLLPLERFGSERRDGDRRLLQRLFAPARGDDDLFQSRARCICGVRGLSSGQCRS